MSDGRKIIDDLRDAFQDGVDHLERVGLRQLDHLSKFAAEETSVSGRPDQPDRRESRKVERATRRADRAVEKALRRARRFGRGRIRRRERAELDPEEREHRRRRRLVRHRTNLRLGFLSHVGAYAATLGIILLATRSVRVAIVVALGWGIGVFCHYLFAIAAPKLRDRWVKEEVGARSARSVRSERREVETRSRRSLEDLSASIAHEIRNPITAAKSLVQQMGEDPASHENLEYAGLALSELDRVERSISHLLRYARDEEPRFEPVVLGSVARSAVEGLRERAASVGVELAADCDQAGAMRGDPEKLRRVIENLISNAIDAIREAATPLGRVDVIGGENLAGNEIWLRVVDNGPGIPVEDRERIWSPFYTTKESGTGLGLALSRKSIEAHGGRIELLTDPRQGSEFILTFPKDPNAESGESGGRGR